MASKKKELTYCTMEDVGKQIAMHANLLPHVNKSNKMRQSTNVQLAPSLVCTKFTCIDTLVTFALQYMDIYAISGYCVPADAGAAAPCWNICILCLIFSKAVLTSGRGVTSTGSAAGVGVGLFEAAGTPCCN